MAIADSGLAPANEEAECPPKNKMGYEEPKLSNELCSAIPQRERRMALRWVMVSGPVWRERGSFLEMETVVW
jgi:hypothetical protein